MLEATTAIALRGGLISEETIADVGRTSDWVTVVQYFQAGSSERDFREAASALSAAFGWPATGARTRVIPVLGLVGDSGRQIHVARILDLSSGTVLGIHKLADLPSPWPASVPAIAPRSIASVVTRCMRAAQQTGDTSAISNTIAEEMSAEVTRVLDEQMDSVVTLVAKAALDHGPDAHAERLASFTTLIEARVRVQRARTAVRREGVDDSVVAQLDSVIGGLDSAASALAGIASTVASETVAAADAAERVRDRRITLLATALLLPALFFALLGINWIPTQGLQEWWMFWVVVGVGVVLAGMGLWIGALIIGKSRSSGARSSTGESDRGRTP